MVVPFIEYEGDTSDCSEVVGTFNTAGEQFGWIKMDEEGVIVDFIPLCEKPKKSEEASE